MDKWMNIRYNLHLPAQDQENRMGCLLPMEWEFYLV